MGKVVNFISQPVIIGYNTGGSVQIICSQLKHALGIQMDSYKYNYQVVYNLIRQFDEINPWTVLIFVIAFRPIIVTIFSPSTVIYSFFRALFRLP